MDGEPLFLLRQLELTNFLGNTFLDAYETYDDGASPADLVMRALTRLGLANKRVAIEKNGWFCRSASTRRCATRCRISRTRPAWSRRCAG
ncbi:MAG: hypothetical protein WDN49_21390 [Acetobacteraceae bacterium]